MIDWHDLDQSGCLPERCRRCMRIHPFRQCVCETAGARQAVVGECCSFAARGGAWAWGVNRRAECTFDDWAILGVPCPFEIRNECGWWWPGEFNEFKCEVTNAHT